MRLRNAFSGMMLALLLLSTVALRISISPLTRAPKVPVEGLAASGTVGDTLIVNDANKFAYFGFYKAAELNAIMVYMNETGWGLFNRVLMWAASYEPPNATGIMLFTPDGTANQTVPNPADEDAAILYNWLLMAGYESLNITVYPDEMVTTLGPEVYFWADVVIYWSTVGYNALDIVLSGVPFITIACAQTDEMEIATGSSKLHEARQNFTVVNNFYDPTQDYPKGPFSFNSSVWINATAAAVNGVALVASEELSEAPPLIETEMRQVIQVMADGNAEMDFDIIVADSPLAEMHRDMFFETLPPFIPGESYPIPETRNVTEIFRPENGVENVTWDAPMEGDVNKDLVVDISDVTSIAEVYGLTLEDESWNPACDIASDHVIDIFDLITVASHYGDEFSQLRPPIETAEPVREQFYNGIMVEQAALHGFLVNMYDSTITPWGLANETILNLKATSPQFAQLVDSMDWRIYVGHSEETNETLRADMKANFTLTRIQYIQQMLQMWAGDQSYQLHLLMEIGLPEGAVVNNYAILNGTTWHIELGMGSYLHATVLANSSFVFVDEMVVVAEQEITIDEQDLLEAFSQYKTFTIESSWGGYSAQPFNYNENAFIEGTVEEAFSYIIYPGSLQYTWKSGSTSATLKITPSLTAEWYIGWRHEWIDSKYRLKWFNTWFKVTPQISAQASVSAAAAYEKTWSRTFGSWSKRFSFWLGTVPVWANLQLKVDGKLTLKATAQISFDCTVTTRAWYKGGVRWDYGSGWSSYYDHGSGGSKNGPTIAAVAKLAATPSATARISFLFYDVAGPFIEGTAYAPTTVEVVALPPPIHVTWTVVLRFKMRAGVIFAGWLKRATGLNDYSSTLEDWQLAQWSGDWYPPGGWNRAYGGPGDDAALAVVQTSDGGYALAGGTHSFGAGDADAWLVKTDSMGNMQWSKTYGGTDDDWASAVVQTSDGGYALVGTTYSFGAGLDDAWLVKTDSMGNMQWSKTYGGTSYDGASAVVQTSDGGYALAGGTHSFGAGDADAWLVKTDSMGNMQWSKTYGGTDYDCAYALVGTNDRGYALAGVTSSSGAGLDDAWLVKTDSMGNMQWSQTYGGTDDDWAYALVQTHDGGYALGGYTSSFGAGGKDFWLVRTNYAGSYLWSKTYGGAFDEIAYSVVQTSDGGYALAGYTTSYGAGNSDFYLVKTIPSGAMQWSKTYGGTRDDWAYALVQTSDEGYALAGATYSSIPVTMDSWLVKTDSTGGM